MDKSDLYRLHTEWIEQSLQSDKLSEWDHEFLTSIKGFLETRGALTPKQVAILEKIYADKT